MKRILLSTTALVAAGLAFTPGDASAQYSGNQFGAQNQTNADYRNPDKMQIAISGFISQYFGYLSQDDRGPSVAAVSGATLFPGGAGGVPSNLQNNAKIAPVFQTTDARIKFDGSVPLVGGLTAYGRMEFQGTTSLATQTRRVYGDVRGPFGIIRLGSQDSAFSTLFNNEPDVFGRSDLPALIPGLVGFGNVGSNSGSIIYGGGPDPNNRSPKINYFTPRFAGMQPGTGLQLAVSYTPQYAASGATGTVLENGSGNLTWQQEWSAAASYQEVFGGFSVDATIGGSRAKPPDDLTNAQNNAASNLKYYGIFGEVGYQRIFLGGYWEKMTGMLNTSPQLTPANNGSVAGATAAKAFGNTVHHDGRVWDIALAYYTGAPQTPGTAAVSLDYADFRDTDCPVTAAATAALSGGACSGDDKYTFIGLSGLYVLGPGIEFSAAIFTGKVQGNNSNNGAAINTIAVGAAGANTGPVGNSFSGVITSLAVKF